jgi:rare lipoprotein A
MKILFGIMTLAVAFFLTENSTASACEFPCFEQRTEKVAKSTRQTGKKTKTRTFTDYGEGSNTGIASFYWQPQAVACGGRFNPSALTAAHKTYPCGSRVLVRNLRNGSTVTVTINDRGPYVAGRIIDLSRAAAQQIGMVNSGLTRVSIQRM